MIHGAMSFQTRVMPRSDDGWAVEYRQSDLESWSTAPCRFTNKTEALDYAAILAEEWDG